MTKGRTAMLVAAKERASKVRLPIELTIALGFLLVTLIVALAFGLPFNLPSSERASFVGVHYLYPLVAVGIWATIMIFTRGAAVSVVFFTALPSYAIVLVCHFNLKLWIPHINPILWDDFYWWTDQAIRPLINGMIAARQALDFAIPLDGNFYMLGFIAMFYLVFIYTSFKQPQQFRELIIAIICLQIIGSVGYLLAPALGPFLYETGVEPQSTSAQLSMLQAWKANAGGGPTWLAAEGGRQLTVGLAAMPSLHTGASFLFLMFAIKRSPVLTGLLAPLFLFIAVDAVANRWHYFLDLPVGMACAMLALYLARKLTNSSPVLVRADAISTTAKGGAERASPV